MTTTPEQAMMFFRGVSQEIFQEDFNRRNKFKRYDLRDYAVKNQINIDECMGIVNKIVEENKYFAGGHMYCTKNNVLPRYKETGEVIIDSDHIKGLMELIAIDLGYMNDKKNDF